MKNILSLIFLIAFSFNLISQGNYITTKSDIKIEGTSNVHDWVSDVTKVSVKCEINYEDKNNVEIKHCNVTIPVIGIISTKGSIMDKKTWKALKYEESPNINFQFVRIESQKSYGKKTIIKTWGNLSIANETRFIPMEVTMESLSDNKIKISGNKKLQMTSFGIEPPTALLGAMTTGDEINIVFDVIIDSSGTKDINI